MLRDKCFRDAVFKINLKDRGLERHQERYSLSLQHEEGRKVVKNYVNLLFNILPIECVDIVLQGEIRLEVWHQWLL